MRGSEAGGGAPRAPGHGRLLALSLCACLASCSFQYDEAANAAGSEPDAVFTGFSHVVYMQGERVLSLKAGRAEARDADGTMLLSDVSFTQYDRGSGAVSATGSADEATFWTDTENAEFRGHISIATVRDDATLRSEFLAWDGKKKLLTSGLDRTVELHRGDGSWVRGAGFSADSRRRSFSFREAVEGRFVVEDEPEAKGEEAAP